MKKILRRILLSIGIIIALVVLLFVGYMLKAKSEIKTMTPVETMNITDNVYSLKDDFSNMYFVEDSGKYIVFDAGNKIENVEAEISKLGIAAEDVVAVFLTHTDKDHSMSLPIFENATVYFSKEEEKLLTGEANRFLFFGNMISAEEYTLLEDHQVINIGNCSIKGILTPGHTVGSMCYLVNGKYLFTGDAIGLKDGKVIGFNKLFNSDTETALKSMNNIRGLDGVEYVFTGHHGYAEYKEAVADLRN